MNYLTVWKFFNNIDGMAVMCEAVNPNNEKSRTALSKLNAHGKTLLCKRSLRSIDPGSSFSLKKIGGDLNEAFLDPK